MVQSDTSNWTVALYRSLRLVGYTHKLMGSLNIAHPSWTVTKPVPTGVQNENIQGNSSPHERLGCFHRQVEKIMRISTQETILFIHHLPG